jgi:hypothetical protein
MIHKSNVSLGTVESLTQQNGPLKVTRHLRLDGIDRLIIWVNTLKLLHAVFVMYTRYINQLIFINTLKSSPVSGGFKTILNVICFRVQVY